MTLKLQNCCARQTNPSLRQDPANRKHASWTAKFVEAISRDAVQDKDLGLVYVATILLDRSYVDADGRRYALSPGLTATVDIRTGTRSILSYLISPLQTTTAQAGRER